MEPRFCLPIVKTKKSDVLEAVRKGTVEYDFFEVWLDYVLDMDDLLVPGLIERLGDRLILLFRRQNLEPIRSDLTKRIGVMQLLRDKPCLLDVDVRTQSEDLAYLKEEGLGIKTILSYHNYQQTPDDDALEEITDNMRGYGPTIYKIATNCVQPEDAVRLLGLLLRLKAEGKRCIVLGMGAHGKVTRVFGTLWGNEMVFAPRELGEQTAPGQLTRSQLLAAFKAMGV